MVEVLELLIQVYLSVYLNDILIEQDKLFFSLKVIVVVILNHLHLELML